jgi:hypothetical protein
MNLDESVRRFIGLIGGAILILGNLPSGVPLAASLSRHRLTLSLVGIGCVVIGVILNAGMVRRGGGP